MSTDYLLKGASSETASSAQVSLVQTQPAQAQTVQAQTVQAQIEPAQTGPDQTAPVQSVPGAQIFTMAGSALNLIGLIAAAMIWYERQTAAATAAGLILMVAGCVVYGIGILKADGEAKGRAKKTFWSVNVWILPFIPLSMVYNILFGSFGTAPYPILTGPVSGFVGFVLFWIVYIGIGTAVELALHACRKA